MSAKTLPDQVADLLIARIFIGDLKPGDRLPPERQFADYLGVDRTSLRMALRQLTRMNLINSVQGSGITVADYMASSGIDFLATVFSIRQLDLGGRFLLEALDQWIFFMPLGVMLASKRPEPMDHHPLQAALEKQLALLAAGSPKEEIVRIELLLHNTLAAELGSTIMRLISNSTELLRRHIVTLFFDTIDVAHHVAFHQEMLRKVLAQELKGMVLMDYYRDYLVKQTQVLRATLKTLPPEPRLLSSPL